ncbi:hypothetical protein [Legionella saoudiensis]|uniref:hypothetical protein n=1 Tax=Legionella saoudiensis TaxID=1750561 RepID=UPI00072FED5D|nr:hypothetical protein [Legionella saoudiensis]
MAEDRSIQDEIAQKKSDMDKEARRLAEDNAIKASQAGRQQLDDLRRAAIAEEIEALKKKAVLGTDKEGRQITKQSVFEDKLKQVMGSEQSSIHDWKSSMMALISVLSAFVEAVNQEVNEKTAPVIVPLKHALKNGIIDMKDTLLDKLRGDPRVNMPTLVTDIKLDANNKLAVNIHAFGKDLDSEEKLPQGLRTLTALWLQEQGYVPDDVGGFLNKETREPLTAETFNELKNHPEDGLNAFLNRSSKVQYSQKEELDNEEEPDDTPVPH